VELSVFGFRFRARSDTREIRAHARELIDGIGETDIAQMRLFPLFSFFLLSRLPVLLLAMLLIATSCGFYPRDAFLAGCNSR